MNNIKINTYLFGVFLLGFIILFSCGNSSSNTPINSNPTSQSYENLQVGAEQFPQYLPLLEGKTVGMVVNQTSVVNRQHLVDILLQKNIDVKKVFAPEHGFRGTADAGESVTDGIDDKTGLPIISLYGNNKKPSKSQLAEIDILLFDIQDVGTRFYTYISTLQYVMEAAAEQQIPIIVLDRPNPNGHYIDGPVLKKEFKSFVGMQSIPIVHGMTVGEYSLFLNGEKLLANGVQADLTVVPVNKYTHTTAYELPIAPSPNLPNQQSIYLYPTLCLFEGTDISVGRGTNTQFQVVGSPIYEIGNYTFTPKPMPGAKQPKHNGELCYGFDFTQVNQNELIGNNAELNLGLIIQIYQYYKATGKEFFTRKDFFDLLAGTDALRTQIEANMSDESIRATWQEDINQYKVKRKKYLLYPDFE